MPQAFLFAALARALLAGEPTLDLLVYRCSRTLGRQWRWLRPLAQRYLNTFGTSTPPRHREVVDFLRRDAGLQRAQTNHPDELQVRELLTASREMQPAPAAAHWDVPAIDSPGDLAKWFGVDPGELHWFTDLKGLSYKNNPQELRHYHYRILEKRFGSVRLIEAPKPRLKELQRQVLRWILAKIPPHESVHGFVRGRSIKTFVAPHVGQNIVLRMDVRDFFPTFGGTRIQNLFRTLGYPEPAADLLGGICTTATPRDVWNGLTADIALERLGELRRFYARPHLPQGAPTSPALANISFYRVDCRLAALAKSAGANYSRYADDLAFSGGDEFAARSERFRLHVASLLREEGFAVHHRKTRLMRRGVRQHLAGLVTNQRVNVARRDFDQLKAILHNCVRSGPEGQNRDAHPRFRQYLEGRVSFVEMIHPEKGKRLRETLKKIQWEI